MDTARLLAGAEHSFDSVRQGSKNTRGSLSELSARLEEKENALRETEKSLRRSRAEVTKLKKVTKMDYGRWAGGGKGDFFLSVYLLILTT